MKTNHLLHYFLLAVAAWLTSIVLGSPLVQAQTFTGQEKLNESPAGFKASVYPVGDRSSTIRINIDNQSRGAIRIQIMDQPGNIWYDEYVRMSFYRQRFDMCFFPAGIYAIILSKPGTTHTTLIYVEPSTPGRITTLPERPVDTFSDQHKRVVSF